MANGRLRPAVLLLNMSLKDIKYNLPSKAKHHEFGIFSAEGAVGPKQVVDRYIF
jgi:hypothetical protein